jgi:hypothetical protein
LVAVQSFTDLFRVVARGWGAASAHAVPRAVEEDSGDSMQGPYRSADQRAGAPVYALAVRDRLHSVTLCMEPWRLAARRVVVEHGHISC